MASPGALRLTTAVKSTLIRSCGRRGRAVTEYFVPARVVVFAIFGDLASCSPSAVFNSTRVPSRSGSLSRRGSTKSESLVPTPRLRRGSSARAFYESRRDHPGFARARNGQPALRDQVDSPINSLLRHRSLLTDCLYRRICNSSLYRRLADSALERVDILWPRAQVAQLVGVNHLVNICD